MKLHCVPGLFLWIALPCLSQDAATPQLSGYITRVASPQDFDVNGQHIQFSAKTNIATRQSSTTSQSAETDVSLSLPQWHPYLGEPATVFGQPHKKQHTIAADRVVLQVRAPHKTSGFGIVDALLPLPSASAPSADHLIRADGYLVLITASTQSTFDKPLGSPSDIQANTWVSFQGTQRADGILLASKARFTKNVVQSTEDHLRARTEYDPAAVPADKKQSGASKFFRGIDVKQLPPTTDAAMQARITAIGTRLIPKYQSSLADTDPTRINFRFQVLDDNKITSRWHDAATLPDGIILIPHSVVERLQNDSQVAALLADNIACALEKQGLAMHVLNEKLTTTQVAAEIGGLFIPGLGLAADIGTTAKAIHAIHASEDQSGRVSLWLLHDSGYDVDQAPIAWWLLAPKKPQSLADTPLPRRAAMLYQFLGESWPTPQSPPAQAAPSVAAVTPPASSPDAPQ